MMLKNSIIFVVIVAVLIVIARQVFALPDQKGRANSTALPPSVESPLHQAVESRMASHLEKTGIHPLVQGTDAFVARMLLADQAQSSLDVQYYIWHDDLTGILLLDRLRAAAKRGVKVRMLVDDNGLDNLDSEVAALNALENFEVRLFNPFVYRAIKPLNYGFDFFRLNHRMHNKSFTVDNVASVIGGRNVGDEYFGTGPKSIFLDLDVLAVGAIVPDISADFDKYWASPRSIPVESLVEDSGDGLASINAKLKEHAKTEQYREYRSASENSDLMTSLLDKSLALEWTNVKLVSDDPSKVFGNVDRKDLLITRLMDILNKPDSSLDLVSAYFIPGKAGTEQFLALEKRGVNVRILTNAFEATDVALVHAGYTKYRDNLLKGGATLFELRSQLARKMGRGELSFTGSSGSSLHAKTFSVDGKHIFVGSFNFDPRSALLNTEMGLMIESPTLAKKVNQLFDGEIDNISYRPHYPENSGMVWEEKANSGEQVIHKEEPGTSVLTRSFLIVVGWLPVEWLL